MVRIERLIEIYFVLKLIKMIQSPGQTVSCPECPPTPQDVSEFAVGRLVSPAITEKNLFSISTDIYKQV